MTDVSYLVEGIESIASSALRVWSSFGKNGGKKSKRKRDVLLNNASLTIKPGSVHAFIGNGCGHRKLLECIALVQTEGFMSGHIQYDSTQRRVGVFKDISFIPSTENKFLSSYSYFFGSIIGTISTNGNNSIDIAHFDSLTVFEYLYYSARLRCPHGVIECRERARVATKVTELEGSIRVEKLTTGELRLLSIAAELVGNPTLLCLADPVKGLDASSASVVLRILKKIAKRTSMPTTVVYVIDSINDDMLRHINCVSVFSETELCFSCDFSEYSPTVKNKVNNILTNISIHLNSPFDLNNIQYGSTDSNSEAQTNSRLSKYIKEAAYEYQETIATSNNNSNTPISSHNTWRISPSPYPVNSPENDTLLDALSPIGINGESPIRGSDSNISNSFGYPRTETDTGWLTSDFGRKSSTSEFISLSRRLGELGVPIRQYKPLWKDVIILVSRTFKYHVKNRIAIQMTIIRFVAVSVVIGILAINDGNLIDKENLIHNADKLVQKGAYNITSILFFIVAMSVAGVSFAVPFLHRNISVQKKEVRAGLYTTTAAIISGAFIDIPVLIVMACIYAAIVRQMLSLSLSSFDVDGYYSSIILVTLSGYSLANLCAVWCSTENIASFFFAFFGAFSVIFTGYQQHIPQLPGVWPWATSTAFTRWAFEGLMISTFRNVQDGDDYLKLFGFDNGSIDFCIMWMSIWLVVLYSLVVLGISPPSYNMRILSSSSSKSSVHYSTVDTDEITTENDQLPSKSTVKANGSASTSHSTSNDTGTSPIVVSSIVETVSSAYSTSPTINKNTKRNLNIGFGLSEVKENQLLDSKYKFNIINIPKQKQVKLLFQRLKYVPMTLEADTSGAGGAGTTAMDPIVQGVTGKALPFSSTCIIDSTMSTESFQSGNEYGMANYILLQILSGRYNQAAGRSSGVITANGERISKTMSYINSAYVPAGDILSNLSVFDTLVYAAKLHRRNSDTKSCCNLRYSSTKALRDEYSSMDITDEQKLKDTLEIIDSDINGRVMEVIAMMGLNTIMNVVIKVNNNNNNHYIYNPLLTPAQLRCISIGCELVTRPSLIFMEDPFFGLDWYNADIVAMAIKSLTAGGRTVICSLNRPTKRIFESFTDTCILGSGLLLFHGLSSRAFRHFEGIGFEPRGDQNSLEFILDVTSDKGVLNNGNSKSNLSPEDLADLCRSMNNINPPVVADTGSSPSISSDGKQKVVGTKLGPPLACPIAHTMLLRGFQGLFCNRRQLILYFLRYALAGVVVGSVWYHLDNGNYQQRVSLLGTVYFAVNVAIVDLFEGIHERKLMFTREKVTNSSNYLAYWITDAAPVQVLNSIGSLIFCIPVYAFSSLRIGFSHTFYFYIMVLAATYSNLGLAYLLSTVTKNATESKVVFNGIIIPLQLLFSGNLILISTMKSWYRWATLFNPMSYFLAGTFRNEFRDNEEAYIDYDNSYDDNKFDDPSDSNPTYGEISDYYGFHCNEVEAFFALVATGLICRLVWLIVLKYFDYFQRREITQKTMIIKKKAKKIITAYLRSPLGTNGTMGYNANASLEEEALADMESANAAYNAKLQRNYSTETTKNPLITTEKSMPQEEITHVI